MSTDDPPGGTETAPAPNVTTSKRGRGAKPEQTRRRLLDAALVVLNRDGYSGATARAIGGEAGCNQASIYYHFGGVGHLLVAALMDSNQRRLTAYREALAAVDDPAGILTTWRELYAEDVYSGHIRALAELVGATAVEPTLHEGVAGVTESWRDLAEATVARAVAGTPLADVVPVPEAADLLLAATLGVELLEHIDGDDARAGRLFDAGSALASLFAAFTAPEDPQRQG